MIQNVLVLGGGSAGFLAAIALRTLVPRLKVSLLHSSELGIIGVGEGTTFAFPAYIHGRLKMDVAEFYKIAQPTFKLGIRFTDWGPRDHFDFTFRPQVTNRWQNLPKFNGFYCNDDFTYADAGPALMSHDKVFLRNAQGGAQIGTDFGYHIENKLFVRYLETVAARLGVNVIEGLVEHVIKGDAGVAQVKTKAGQMIAADLFVDCSGFASVLLGKTLDEPFKSFNKTLYCDRAVVCGWDRTTEPVKPHTTAQAMDAGWCWQIEHEHRIIRGYVYSSSFMSDEQAELEFRAKNPKVHSTRIVKFISGRYERGWVDNVVAIGNSAGFVEPLEATSLGQICDECEMLSTCLNDSDLDPTPTIKQQYNLRNGGKWDQIRDFLGVHYKFNTRQQTPFWHACRNDVELHGAQQVADYFMENGPACSHRQTLLTSLNQFGLEGYWSLLIGQKVPQKKPYQPTATERDTWRQIQQSFKAKAANAINIPEALRMIRSPGFVWPANLYHTSGNIPMPV